MLKRIKEILAPITVSVHWDGLVTVHKTHSRAEALEWLSCYPVDATVFVYNRFQRDRGYCAAIRRPS